MSPQVTTARPACGQTSTARTAHCSAELQRYLALIDAGKPRSAPRHSHALDLAPTRSAGTTLQPVFVAAELQPVHLQPSKAAIHLWRQRSGGTVDLWLEQPAQPAIVSIEPRRSVLILGDVGRSRQTTSPGAEPARKPIERRSESTGCVGAHRPCSKVGRRTWQHPRGARTTVLNVATSSSSCRVARKAPGIGP